MLEEADYKEVHRSIENASTRRVASTNSTSPNEKSRPMVDFVLQTTSTLSRLDVHVLPEKLLEEIEVVNDVSDFENVHLAYLDTIVQKDGEMQHTIKVSLEDEKTIKASNSDSHHSFNESHMLDRKTMSTTTKRTKPRARVATNYVVFDFEPLDSLVCGESEEESLISSDD
uniref:Uncharacterized protein n=1 Tax=Lactuca sativa TaxID=4236 RepID=A0A9R1WTU5_LACSA|nr:hypothetical protein LSAT_V11C900485810 [Lactuca sativa]